eukprot:jgi/Psemu1/56684/gm1.56684_g
MPFSTMLVPCHPTVGNLLSTTMPASGPLRYHTMQHPHHSRFFAPGFPFSIIVHAIHTLHKPFTHHTPPFCLTVPVSVSFSADGPSNCHVVFPSHLTLLQYLLPATILVPPSSAQRPAEL